MGFSYSKTNSQRHLVQMPVNSILNTLLLQFSPYMHIKRFEIALQAAIIRNNNCRYFMAPLFGLHTHTHYIGGFELYLD